MRVDTVSSVSIVARIADTVISGTLLCVETAAQLSLGQTILRMVDRFLWIVEKSAQWSLPCQEEEVAEENGESFGRVELVRPLPWMFFLTTLIILRTFRLGLNVGAFVLGYPKIEPNGTVKFLQKSRRRLRAIKLNGMKYMRQRKDCTEIKVSDSTMNDIKWKSTQLLRSIQLTLSGLSCLDGSKLSPSPPPMKMNVCMSHESTPTPEKKSSTKSSTSPMHVESNQKYSEVSSDGHTSEEDTIAAKVDCLATLNDSLADDDFNRDELFNSDDDSSSISGDSNVSATEIQNIQDEANLILHRAFAGVAEVITEEPELVKRADAAQERTGRSEKLENPSTSHLENSEEHQEYHSPCKFGDDGDTTFYSPISSNSSSPDRTTPVIDQGRKSLCRDNRRAPNQNSLQVWPGGNGVHTTNTCRNGEVNTDLKKPITGSSTVERTNGHADGKGSIATNVSARANKPHHRGRRVGHASRKKK